MISTTNGSNSNASAGPVAYKYRSGIAVSLLVILSSCAPGPTPQQPPEPTSPSPTVQPEPIETMAPTATPRETETSLPTGVPVGLDTVRAGRFDNGKMWTFDYPPTDYLTETYGLTPDEEWYERARLGALRIPNCSASFVSPRGLVMTNHHCARESVSQVSEADEGLLDNGFYATSLEEERPVADFHADQLIEIVDVTAEVDAALVGIQDPTARADVREAISEEIQARMAEERGGEEAGIVVETISFWNGARVSAYVFQRYDSVKLVMAPELQIGFFGGDPDNFTYPRYNLDFSFFRVYGDDGEPVETEHYFGWSEEGVEEGDPVFIIGNPGSTTRLQTVSQLAFRREVEDRALLQFLSSRIGVLESYLEDFPVEAEELDIRNRIFSLLNSQKAFNGILGGLNDPILMARRADTERAFRDSLVAHPELQAEYGELFDRIDAIQSEKEVLTPELFAYAAFGSPDFSASILIRGIWALQIAGAQNQGAPPEALADLEEQMAAVPQQPAELQIRLLAARLQDLSEYVASKDLSIRQFLSTGTPMEIARRVVEGSILADSLGAMQAVDSGDLAMTDPAIEMTLAYLQSFFGFQNNVVSLSDREEELAAQLGRARFEVFGTTIPPDATFSLRVADGVVRPFEYNGTVAPVYTTFFGMYDRYHSHTGETDSPWDLPERWKSPPEEFDLSTPVNFISTNDIIGGNSGSPVLNRDLEVVGLVFDGNIESLPGDYIYVDTKNRSVSVDARGIIEALDDIYDADRIVLELLTGVMHRTEEEADRAGR